MTRDALRVRQQHVLAALLRGDVPEGFEARSADLTIRTLRTKRRSEAVAAVPMLRDVDDLVVRFDAWAATTPRRGCVHDDVVDFLASDDGPLPEPLASIRAVERVYRRRARRATDRRGGARRWVVAVGSRVWHVGPRSPRRVEQVDLR
ncbi:MULTISPECIES: hypothetical protein [Aeromicrobium]|uniref:hypothetical protein n=1 Tax=Aeromicrobium TaxID=2040 RepID=UPI0006F54B4B|nr:MULTISPECIES: hypothetical protein [Aeromicrobium]KQX74918.1 hypothetical protein ASD10_06810 [Aeromicrobium sp. Root472D3]MCL8253169.1 hypothetical protein [Aeromicrobium fastidiosum]